MEKVNVRDALAGVSDYWSPVVLAELNGQEVRVAKLKGEFVWHRHEHEDELFLVISGNLRIDLKDRSVELAEGELLVVPSTCSRGRGSAIRKATTAG